MNEITQARGCDVVQVRAPFNGLVWMLTIAPEAGNQKGNTARDVPLHPHLIEQGFLDFVAGVGPCPTPPVIE